ncbi:ATP-dependent Clp protease [Plasmodium vivax India VII]|uniref:ATP-dependent Clp protease n=1 Tax=Plasmodium vivax India VII TaxID=1077284 RepID=A0A0J9S6L2_PLAVI|nr:ATP-dependent Clp protease [Plasmodium vivax India VII]
MNALYLLLAMLSLNLVVTIHTRTQPNFLNSTLQLNKCNTWNLRRTCRKIKPRNNKLRVSLFDEYDEKCIRALIMAREVAKNHNEKEILLKHLLIAIIRIDSNLVKHILNFCNISLTTFLDKLNNEMNKTGGETNFGTNRDEPNASPGEVPRQLGMPTDQHHPPDNSREVVEGGAYPANDPNGENQLMSTFINKHIQDIEDKINQLKNLEEGQSDISTEGGDADSSVGGADERDEAASNLIRDAAKRVLGGPPGESPSELPSELPSDVSKELSRQLPSDLQGDPPDEKADERADDKADDKADIKFSQNCKRVLHNAVLEARRKKKMFVSVTDILIALINMAQESQNCEFLRYLSELNISVNDLKRELTGYDEGNCPTPPTGTSHRSNAQRDGDLNANSAEKRGGGDSQSGTPEKRDDNQRMRSLNNRLNNEPPNHHLMNNLNSDYLHQTREFKNYEESSFPPNGKLFNSSYVKDCLTDMVQAAYEKGDEHFFGRKKEIKRIIEILGRRKKSNPLLIGESGVGKTAIIEHLSHLILKDKVPYHLRNCRIYQLNVGNIVAGTKYRGEFEEKMKHLLSNMNKKKKNILFIDEIHVIVGAGSGEGSLDASNLLKPFLSSDNLQCIGTTTFQEYTKYIESDKALRRRFNCVPVKPFTGKETLLLLKKIKYSYEKYHNIYYTNEALKSIVMLTEDYLPTANFPDKAIDILDEAGAYQKIRYEVFMRRRLRGENHERSEWGERVERGGQAKSGQENGGQVNGGQANGGKLRSDQPSGDEHGSADQDGIANQDSGGDARSYLQNMHIKYVTSDVIENIVSKKASISYIKKNKKEEEKIIKLKEKLNKIIIGQEKVIDILSRYLFKAITNIKDPNKPIGTLLLCGSSGVGKTLCAQVISKYLFNEDNLIVINMSEYIDKHSVSKLFGSYPGYVGYKEGGELTESVKKKPFSIILFDEIEKAHGEVLHVLLQILDNGMLTDSKGNKVSFKNTFIFMTTNVGSDIVTDYFKLYNRNYSNMGFKYYLSKRPNRGEADGSLLPEGVNSVANSVEEDPTGLSSNSGGDLQTNRKDDHPVEKSPTQQPNSYDLFEEKLRTNKWYEELQPEIEEELKKKFLPEFLNRIDEKIIFRQFLKRDVINIFQNMIDDLKKRIKKRKNLNLIIEPDVIKYICSDENNIYDMNFGARSIRRALYRYIEDPIASFLISNLCEPNDSIYVSLSSGNKIDVQLVKAPVEQLVL